MNQSDFEALRDRENIENVNQSDFEALRDRDNTIENTDSNTDSTETDDGRTAEVDVSEITLCAENMDNHNTVAKGSLGTQKVEVPTCPCPSDPKGSLGTQKVEVPTSPCPSDTEGQGHVGSSTKDSNTVGEHVKHDDNVFTVEKNKDDIESENVKVVRAFNVGKNMDEVGSDDKKVVQTDSVMVQTVDEAGVKVVKTEISEEKSEKRDTVAGEKTCYVEDEGKKRKKSSVSFDLESKEGLNKGIGLHDQSTGKEGLNNVIGLHDQNAKECGTVNKSGDKQKKTFQVEKAKLNDDDGVVFIVGSDSSLVNVKSDQTVESEIKSLLSGSAETKSDTHGLEVQV